MPYYVYILSNAAGTVLYTGVTNDVLRRTWEHREGLVPGFASKYKVSRLVYVEEAQDVSDAIEREKAIKGGSRKRKVALIEAVNPAWRDLYEET